MDSHTISVDLGERSYPIVIGADLIANRFDLTPHLAGKHCLVVSSKTVAPLYLDSLQSRLERADVRTVTLPDGEKHKTVATTNLILDELVACKANRDTTVIALGGGVVGDIAGFAAACFMRGVAFIQVPTTLLAQVDSSVGGKTGVNHPGGKNLIGAFHQPRIVLIDTDTLKTLPDRELRSGLAEVIKYGAIVDIDFFAWLESNMAALLERDPATLAYAIRRSCEIKAEVVAADERETGRRALLNFGHTFGHAIEHCVGYGEWLHGEAVAAGMVMAAAMSGIDPAEQDRLKTLLTAADLPCEPPQTGAVRLREAMQMDKKAQAGRLRFVLLRSLGDAYVSTDYEPAALDGALSASES